MPSRPLLSIAVLGALAASCGDDSPTAPRLVTDLPRSFRLTGSASGNDADGRTVTCALDLLFELGPEVRRTSQRVDYEGTHGGEAGRTVLARDGSGFAFVADVFGGVEAHLFVTGSVEILIPVNLDAEGRFWRNLARFAGSMDARGGGEGLWTCAPLDIDTGGYLDQTLAVDGTWRIAPEPTAS